MLTERRVTVEEKMCKADVCVCMLYHSCLWQSMCQGSYAKQASCGMQHMPCQEKDMSQVLERERERERESERERVESCSERGSWELFDSYLRVI